MAQSCVNLSGAIPHEFSILSPAREQLLNFSSINQRIILLNEFLVSLNNI